MSERGRTGSCCHMCLLVSVDPLQSSSHPGSIGIRSRISYWCYCFRSEFAGIDRDEAGVAAGRLRAADEVGDG